jgi:uncharacterized protein (DUF342 family)
VGEDNEILKRDGWFRVHIAPNFMEASLELEPPQGEGRWPSKYDAMEALRSEGIVYGLMENVLEWIVANHSTDVVAVAKGKEPEPGADAEITLLFETGAFRKLAEAGDSDKVDYRDVQTIQNVIAGQPLAKKTPATAGISGMDIYGRKIDPVPGKDKYIKLGKNVAWTEDNLKVISKINGEPNYVMNQLNVYPVHELNGDVNFKSGNISFLGSVLIRGNVDGGFRVETEGNVTVQGCVEAAEIKAGGTVTIRGGVNGMGKCNIVCNGDFTAKYIENAKIDCGGAVTVREAIMHCEVNADGRVLVEMGKGLIVGGLIRAGEYISAKTIGSRFGTLTELEAGVRPKLKIEYQQLEAMIPGNKENLDKSEKAIAILEKLPVLPPERQEMYRNLLKTVSYLRTWLKEAEERKKVIRDEIYVISKGQGKVRVREMLFPGIKVTIAGAVMVVRDEYKYVTLAHSEGEVKVLPYR